MQNKERHSRAAYRAGVAGFAVSYAKFLAVCRFRQYNAGVSFFDVFIDQIPPHRLPTCHPEQRRRIPGNGHPVITQKHSNANQHKHLTNFAHEPAETALGGEPAETGVACNCNGDFVRQQPTESRCVRTPLHVWSETRVVVTLPSAIVGPPAKTVKRLEAKVPDNVCFARFGRCKIAYGGCNFGKIFRKSYFVEFRRSAFGFVWRCFSCHLRRLEKNQKFCAKCG